jgi:hypothetical protein
MQLTTWLLARESEAAAIATITTGEHSLDDWPHLSLPLIEMDLMALSAAVHGTDDIAAESTLESPPLVEDSNLLVARVRDSFIQSLARVSAEDQPALVATWARRLDMEQPEVRLREHLSELAGFAREAVARQLPVLTLVTF